MRDAASFALGLWTLRCPVVPLVGRDTPGPAGYIRDMSGPHIEIWESRR